MLCTKVTSIISVPVKSLKALVDSRVGEVEIGEAHTTAAMYDVYEALSSKGRDDPGSRGLALMFSHCTKESSSYIIKPIPPRDDKWAKGNDILTHQPEYHSTTNCATIPKQHQFQAPVTFYRLIMHDTSNGQDLWWSDHHNPAGITLATDMGEADEFGSYHTSNPFRIYTVAGERDRLFEFNDKAKAECSSDFHIDTEGLDGDLGKGVHHLRLQFIKKLDEHNVEVEASCFVQKDQEAAARWHEAGFLKSSHTTGIEGRRTSWMRGTEGQTEL